MNKKNIPLNYVNSLVYELEKAFWDERGKGARFRLTTIGQQYFDEKVDPLLQSAEIDHILQTIHEVLQGEGITARLTFNKEDRLLRVGVAGCIHKPIEEKFNSLAIEPFTCIPANLIVLAVEKKLNIPVELAEIKIEEGTCQLLLILFDKRPTLE